MTDGVLRMPAPIENDSMSPTLDCQARSGCCLGEFPFHPYTGSFAPGRLDGRELAGAIARKL